MPREELDDELARLRDENSSLKRYNLEQGEKVKQLSVQMVRIQKGWQQQAVPKDVPPTEKARLAKEVAKEHRIAELESQLSYFKSVADEAREAKIKKEISHFKQAAGASRQPTGRGRGPAES
eukprot:4933330-Prymnesium_polylepis.1